MIFNKLYEARNWFLQYKPLEEKVPFFWTEYNHKPWEFGDYIFFQHIKVENKAQVISRPILAIFTGFKIWDQALVINFVQKTRAWMYSHEVVTNPDINYTMTIAYLDDEVESIQFWTDNIKILGYWKNRPTFSELKQSLK